MPQDTLKSAAVQPVPAAVPAQHTHQFSSLHFLTGAIAGSVSRTMTSPLERLKILRQVTTVEYAGLSLSQAFAYMWKQEGWRGFFKGNGVNIVKIAPFSALEFYFYELFKHTFYHDRPANDYTSKLICGGMTGIAAQTLTYPLDLIRTILTIQVNTGEARMGIYSCGRNIYVNEGTRGLFKGLFASVVGITPFIGIKMTSFDLLKHRFLPNKTDPRFDMINLCLGALAGTIAVTLTYPTDVIRRLLQLSGKDGHPVYTGMIDCFTQVYRKDGFPGWFRGLIPCYLKVIPMTAILFMTNERLKKWFGI